MTRRFIRCGQLFAGDDDEAAIDRTLVIEEDGRISFAGPTSDAPTPTDEDEVADHSDCFVMPGLIDAHTHLSYGDALAQEDIDLYSSMEFRTLRAMLAAQKVLRAGYTSILDPASSGLVSVAVRDAIEAGMFPGPRISAAGRALTTRQGLYDWYPSWVGVPDTSTGVLVRNRDEAIEEIRRQVKDGVDAVKLTMDGIMSVPSKGLVASFTQEETTAMVIEIQRLGRKAVVHARGTEGCLYAARAGADIIYHGSGIDDAGIEAALENGCHICPSLLLLVHTIELTQPTDASSSWWPPIQDRELREAGETLAKARAAGIPFLMGSETGFAVTPFGEWHAKELECCVRYLGFAPADVLRSTTTVNASMLNCSDGVGILEEGKLADLIVVNGDPLKDISVLQDRDNIIEIRKSGALVDLAINDRAGRLSTEFAQNMWSELYTRDRVERMNVRPHRPQGSAATH